MINSNILKAWNEERIRYQIRYAKSCAEYHKYPENLDSKGHMHEQSWVLINVFGLSAKQVEEVEREEKRKEGRKRKKFRRSYQIRK